MTYIAIHQATAEWILSHPDLLCALYDDVFSGVRGLFGCDLHIGQFRAAGSDDGAMVAIWNRDYISGTGEEAWGFIKLDGELGLFGAGPLGRQVFERAIFVANQRLQGLMLDSDLYHRSFSNGAHTCLAGRGNEARHQSIAYYEGERGSGGGSARAVVIVGPGRDFDELSRTAEFEAREAKRFTDLADSILQSKVRRPLLEASAMPRLRNVLEGDRQQERAREVSVSMAGQAKIRTITEGYRTLHFTYDHWLASDSPLNDVQRRILGSDGLLRHPVRIVGPAGSGKTLLMQLLALKRLRAAKEADANVSALYVVHNAAMATTVKDRFIALGAEEFLTSPRQTLTVSTLSEYSLQRLGVEEGNVIDKDAYETKRFQRQIVKESLVEAIDNGSIAGCPLLKVVSGNDELISIFASLMVSEISTAIKGHGLVEDEKKYVASERSLSRLHAIMTQGERRIAFDCFKRYHYRIFDEAQMLDSDDLALTLIGRLRTPFWQLRRKAEGFDFVFVDEAQLFNENEKKLFSLITKSNSPHVPVALALDEAQELYGFTSAGLATLGIEFIENEELPSVQRSTKEITDLAFFVIQRSTDLFGADFPDFTMNTEGTVPSDHPLAARPVVSRCGDQQRSYGRFVVKEVQKLRRSNLRQVAVVCLADTLWSEVEGEITESGLPLHVIKQRGEKISPDEPLVVLTRPAYVGGQEFDAVICVGLEQGVFPPRISDNEALAVAVEQQALREMYLSFTRARYRLVIAIGRDAAPNNLLQEAVDLGFLDTPETKRS